MARDISDLVARVTAEYPLPEQLGELPASIQRRLECDAEAAGLTTSAYYAAQRASVLAEAAASAEAPEIVASIQRLRSGVV